VRRVTEETLGWLAREMTSPEGGFYSSLDADSEGHEGRYYVWDSGELDALLGEDARLLKAYWGVTPEGNFEGRNILFVPHDPARSREAHGVTEHELRTAIDRATRILYDARERRVRPARDEKMLAAWNGLMLRGVAEAARVFGDAELRAMALRNGEFLFREMVRDGRCFVHARTAWRRSADSSRITRRSHSARRAVSAHVRRVWLDARARLGDEIIARFWDDEGTGVLRHRVGRRAARDASRATRRTTRARAGRRLRSSCCSSRGRLR
jgi:uncharacterized protein YyaL (SSP411 family)